MALDASGQHLTITGDFPSYINFGGSTLSGDPAYGDIFLLQLAP